MYFGSTAGNESRRQIKVSRLVKLLAPISIRAVGNQAKETPIVKPVQLIQFSSVQVQWPARQRQEGGRRVMIKEHWSPPDRLPSIRLVRVAEMSTCGRKITLKECQEGTQALSVRTLQGGCLNNHEHRVEKGSQPPGLDSSTLLDAEGSILSTL
jgi:hypothetical protein